MKDENLYAKETKDWINYIVEKTYEHYDNRKIVLWGKYSISDSVKEKLIEKYGIDVAFYVDKDIEKIDNICVFPTDCLQGKSCEYYIIVSLAFYQSLKDELTGGGYRKDLDYCYFADCIIRQTSDYYEDSHGNKVIGNYQGLKIAFRGFGSIIQIKGNTHFQGSTIYVHNNARITIGDNADLTKSTIHLQDNVGFEVGDSVGLAESTINSDHGSDITIKNDCNIWRLSIYVKCGSSVSVGERTNINEGIWSIFDDSKIEIGCLGRFEKGRIAAGNNSFLKIGNNLAIMWTYQIVIDDYTSIAIGDDCIISYDVIIRSNDGHSIFDLKTGKNINSIKEVSQLRKIVVGNHVWIGMRSIILYNTEIGNGSIIGAASLLKGSIPNNCIAVGIPAKVKKSDVAWEREYGAENFQETWDYRESY